MWVVQPCERTKTLKVYILTRWSVWSVKGISVKLSKQVQAAQVQTLLSSCIGKMRMKVPLASWDFDEDPIAFSYRKC